MGPIDSVRRRRRRLDAGGQGERAGGCPHPQDGEAHPPQGEAGPREEAGHCLVL